MAVILAKHKGGASLPARILMTDAARLPDPLAAAARLPAGSAVLLRHYDADDRVALGRALKTLCRRRGLMLLVAGDVGLADRLEADGVHLPEVLARRGVLHRVMAWRTAKPGRLLTMAAHSPAALARAAMLGADMALVSPVFPTASHPDAAPIGPVRLAAWTGTTAVPVAALGGISNRTHARLAGTGIVAVAGISGLA